MGHAPFVYRYIHINIGRIVTDAIYLSLKFRLYLESGREVFINASSFLQANIKY